jgi:hypothetical protein
VLSSERDRTSVALLELMVPAVEVDVENDNRTCCQTGQQESATKKAHKRMKKEGNQRISNSNY